MPSNCLVLIVDTATLCVKLLVDMLLSHLLYNSVIHCARAVWNLGYSIGYKSIVPTVGICYYLHYMVPASHAIA